MKTLATCTPREFLKQTFLIKKAAEKWMTATDIMEIRKRLPALRQRTPDMTKEDLAELKKENDRLMFDQSMKNLSDMFDAVAGEHPDETLELLALLCFVDPADVDSHPVGEYLEAIADLMANKSVRGFFGSLAQLGAKSTPILSRA